MLGIGAALALPVLLAPARTAEWVADASLALPGRDAGLEKFDLARFREIFNSASGGRRVIAIFSPT